MEFDLQLDHRNANSESSFLRKG